MSGKNAFAKTKASPLAGVLGRSRQLAGGASVEDLLAETADVQAGPGVNTPEQLLHLSRVHPNPDQPRKHFDPAKLQELADSIAAQGLLQAITVRPAGDGYQIVFGERRYRASQLAGATHIRAVVRDLSDEDVALLAALENLQREDLNPFEAAQFKVQLIAGVLDLPAEDVPARLRRLTKHPGEDEQAVTALTALFARLGREQWTSFTRNGLSVLTLPEPLLGAVKTGQLDYTKAVRLRGAPGEHLPALLEETLRENLSVSDITARIAALTPRAEAPARITTLRARLQPRALERLSKADRTRADRLMAELLQLLDAGDVPAQGGKRRV